MEKYVLVQGKAFEKLAKYQTRLNDQARKGYRAVSMSNTSGVLCTLFEKIS